MAEKFQLGVEAQFARMLFAVVVLFYISWSTIVVSGCVCVKRERDGEYHIPQAITPSVCVHLRTSHSYNIILTDVT